MAKTVDELVIKMTVEGQAQIKESTTNMDQLDAATKKTSETLRQSQGNIRNVAFQVQDLAVQIAGGTNAFVALGQQIPQLLGGFGVLGAVIGAVAAVGIPLARAGLQALGFDFRNLEEILKDTTQRVSDFKDAQKNNLGSVDALRYQYGTLAVAAKDFYDVQERLSKFRAQYEISTQIKKIQEDFGGAYDSYDKFQKKLQERTAAGLPPPVFGGQFGPTDLTLGQWYKFKFQLDITTEQAVELGRKLKDLDKNAPERNVQILTDVAKYLEQISKDPDQFKKIYDNAIEPLLKTNMMLLEYQKNLRAAAEQASVLNQNMMFLEYAAAPDINAARRNFDQITAIRREGELRYQQFKLQLDEKTKTDGVDREGELATFRLKNQQDVNEKIKDFAKGQYETYRAATLTNEAKIRQLNLESQLLKIQDANRYNLGFNIQYEEDLARSAKEYADTLASIAEQRRKNLITSGDQKKLEQDALDMMNRANALAGQARDKRMKDFISSQDMENMKKAIEDQIARAQKLGDVLRSVNDQKIDVQFESTQIGRGTFEKTLARITEDARKAGLAAGRQFAESFGGEDGLTPEKAQELVDGLARIRAEYEALGQAQVANVEAARTWEAGWSEAYANYKDNAMNAAEQAKSVFESTTRTMEDAIVKFAMTGKLNFSDFANSIISDIIRIQVRRAIANASGAGGIFSLFGFANGGEPPVNVPSIVGENGPELFVPKTAGTIVPAGKAGSGAGFGTTSVTYNINAVDASSFRQLVAQDPQFIYNITEVGRRSVPSRRLA